MKRFGINQFNITKIDTSFLETARRRQAQLTKPAGSLGRLEDIAVQLAGIQQTSSPSAESAKCLIVAADHPVAKHGVSAFPSSVTPAMIHNILEGGAASSVMAKTLNVPLEIVDVGVHGLSNVRSSIQFGYTRSRDAADGHVGDLSTANAMSKETFLASVQAGIDAVDRLADVNVLLLGELGIGNTTVAASVCAHLLRVEPERLVGRGTGVDDCGLKRKLEVVQSALNSTSASSPAETIQQIGGRDIAAMFGAIGRAAEKGICVVVDGYVVAAAALALLRTYPEALDYLIWSHCSKEQGHDIVLKTIGKNAVFDLEYRLGEATGALTVYPLLKLACAVHRQMATFDDAQVPNRGD